MQLVHPQTSKSTYNPNLRLLSISDSVVFIHAIVDILRAHVLVDTRFCGIMLLFSLVGVVLDLFMLETSIRLVILLSFCCLFSCCVIGSPRWVRCYHDHWWVFGP